MIGGKLKLKGMKIKKHKKLKRRREIPDEAPKDADLQHFLAAKFNKTGDEDMKKR